MKISEAESYVMDILWEQSPQTADDVIAELSADKDWSPATIKTLLNRLLNKGVIGADRQGRKYLYTPIVSRQKYVQQETRGFLDRMFDGKLSALVSHFSNEQTLSQDEITRIKQMIQELENDE